MLQSGKATVMPGGHGLGPGLQGPGDEMNVHPPAGLGPTQILAQTLEARPGGHRGRAVGTHTPGTSGPAFVLVCECGHVPPGLSLLPVHGQWMDTRRRGPRATLGGGWEASQAWPLG